MCSKTLALLHDMEFRQVANTIWAIGKLRLDLKSMQNGDIMAGEFQQKVLEEVDRGGLSDARHSEQLWYGLQHTRYPWSADFLASLRDHTLEALPEWDDGKSLGQVMCCFGHLRLPVEAKHKQRMAEVVCECAAPQSSDAKKAGLQAMLNAVRMLGLELPLTSAKLIHDILSEQAVAARSSRDKGHFGEAVLTLTGTRLNYQPTTSEAASWHRRLISDLQGRWRAGDLAKVLNGLASMANFRPSEEAKQEYVQAVAGMAGPIRDTDAMQILKACRTWGVLLPPPLEAALVGSSRRYSREAGPGRGGRGPSSHGRGGGRGGAPGGGRRR